MNARLQPAGELPTASAATAAKELNASRDGRSTSLTTQRCRASGTTLHAADADVFMCRLRGGKVAEAWKIADIASLIDQVR
jgi:hypothetical protein